MRVLAAARHEERVERMLFGTVRRTCPDPAPWLSGRHSDWPRRRILVTSFRLHPDRMFHISSSTQTPRAVERCDTIHAVRREPPEKHGEANEASARHHPLIGGQACCPAVQEPRKSGSHHDMSI